MMKVTMRFAALACFGLALCGIVHAKEYQEMEMYGIIYPNSCGTEQKKILWGVVYKAKAFDEQKAIKILDLMLCAPDSKENRKTLMSSFGKIVYEEVESTGEQTRIKTVVVTEKLVKSTMASRSVWHTTLLAERNKIKLQYFVNEACVKSAKLTYSHSKWTIYEIGEACD